MAQLAVMAFTAIGQLYKGKEQEQLKERETQAYLDAADRRQAAMTFEAAEAQRERNFIYSRALSVAGAQSGNTRDAGVQTLLADLNAEGDYRILSTIWVGQTETEGLRFRAEAARREGRAAKTASYVSAVTSAVSGYASMGGKEGSFGKFMSKHFTAAGQTTSATASMIAQHAKMGEVWDEVSKSWVKKSGTGGLKIPSYRPSGFESTRWGF